MLINRKNLHEHLPWMVASLVVTGLAMLWYWVVLPAGSWDQRPRGSSWPGFTFGVAGGLICLFEFLLWPRKMKRVWRVGPVVLWMRAHIWLGLLSFPLLVLHSGFYLGGLLSTILMVLFLVVIASGIWGLVMQQFLPRRMLDDVPAETIFSQIDNVSRLQAAEADRLVQAVCGPTAEAKERASPVTVQSIDLSAEATAHSHLVVGAVRSFGGVRGKVLQTQAYVEPVPDSEALRDFFRTTILPYIREGAASGSPLAQPSRSGDLFTELRDHLNKRAYPAVDTLEALCAQRRQLDLQIRLHRWLHNWLWVHLPLSIALIVLMFVHIWVALKYI